MRRASVLALGLLALTLTSATAGPARPPVKPAGANARPTGMPAVAELIDLNGAARSELVALPGVGEAIADKIIAGRPWKTKLELVQRSVVTRAGYARFSARVIARLPGK